MYISKRRCFAISRIQGYPVEFQHLYLHKGAEEEESSAMPTPEAAPVVLTETELAPALMEEYVGYYYEDGRLIEAELIDKHLVFHFPWESNVRVFADSADRFYLKSANVQYTFRRDDEGQVDQMSIVTPNGSYPHGRIDPMISDCDQAGGICGNYHSDELQTSYLLRIEEGLLIADHFQNEDVKLFRLDTDHYLGNKWWFSSMKVLRDENNKVCGFTVNADQDNIQKMLWIKKFPE